MPSHATRFLDTRIPVGFGPAALDGGTALLVEGDAPAPAGTPVARFTLPVATGHSAGCPCCAPRGPVAAALGGLFLARAKGEAAWFERVVALTQGARGREAVLAALANDPLVSARFRAA